MLPLPPVRGLAAAGGFRYMIEDRDNLGVAALQEEADRLVAEGNDNSKGDSELRGLLTVFRAATPQLYATSTARSARSWACR